MKNAHQQQAAVPRSSGDVSAAPPAPAAVTLGRDSHAASSDVASMDSGWSVGHWDAFGHLRHLGLQTQALKSALAAGLAWAVGAYVPWGPAQPYLAPLTAILTVQATI